MVFGEVIGGCQALATATNDHRIIFPLRLGAAPSRLPAFVPAQGLAEEGKSGVFVGHFILPVGALKRDDALGYLLYSNGPNTTGQAEEADRLADGTRSRGPQRTSREDWIEAALDTLISEGVDQVKVTVIAEKLSCARSSFYWYFKNRAALLDALLDHWQSTNAKSVISKSLLPAASINVALINVFACWVDESLFDTRLDFAIREWARRSGTVRRALDISDSYILDALAQMFMRYSFTTTEAETRARIVYYTQIGYNTMDPQETMAERVKRGPEYVFCMTGQALSEAEIKLIVKPEG